MEAVLRDLKPLVYASGGSAEHDVPAHVRAASAIRRSGTRLVIVQDDVNVLALHEPGIATEALLLPAGPGGVRVFDDGRGNKSAKMDLEACTVLPDGRLVAFGSGSTRARDRLVVFDGADVRLVEARALYERLRAEPAFSGSELNVEGAVIVGDRVRLFQRGNGAAAGGRSPVNATGDLPLEAFLCWLDGGGASPELEGVVQYDLGHIRGVSYTFTDAAIMANGSIVFIACAEASPDTVRDGEVLGCRFGIFEGDEARLAEVRHEDGSVAELKLEGIEACPGAAGTFDVVADMDRPNEAALLGKLEVTCLPDGASESGGGDGRCASTR